jgi:hypothetical protein
MSKLSALALSALLASSCITWKGQSGEVTATDASRGLKDVPTLTREYENARFFTALRRRFDGRSNAFQRDLESLTSTIDRHFFNYSVDDPYVNFPTEFGPVDHVLGTAVTTVTPLPLAQDLMRR